ncbi:ATP-dependent RNA helicase dbp2 [Orbilia blumenaviensis]|uniref:ATP-dependent RNA helicase dbp2 n=1 Tax=Orbilia blumenaviensis TaxID=1796055 RepID=A0AAV9V7P2_9PEZI
MEKLTETKQTARIMFTVLAVQDVQGKEFVPRSPRPIYSLSQSRQKGTAITFFTTDNAKQARDLVTVLTEAKQQIDPRLSDMARGPGYGGGSSRGRWGGPRGGRGGFTSSNTAPLGSRRY